MRIGFKYPPVERGMDINIVTNLFFGAKDVYVNGEKATLIDKRRSQYKYYDPNLGRDRVLAVVVPIIDYPQFYIDGKEYKLFPRVHTFFKWLVFLPIIYDVFFDVQVIFFAFLLSLINIALNVSLIKILRNNVLRIIFVLMMTAAGGFLTFVIINVFYEILVDWGWITPETTSSAAAYIQALIHK